VITTARLAAATLASVGGADDLLGTRIVPIEYRAGAVA
jgi:hypothetical protein